jgi:predicted XRE-type DNA-binding protein
MSKIEHEKSSGNVFADLGLSDAKDRQIKVALAMKISTLAERRKLSQQAAAQLLGTTQSCVSAIMRYQLKDISLEKLLDFLTKLDHDVKISIKRKSPANKFGEVQLAL